MITAYCQHIELTSGGYSLIEHSVCIKIHCTMLDVLIQSILSHWNHMSEGFAGILWMSFSRATNFANQLKKEIRGNYFHESTLVSSLLTAICVTIEFSLIFGETNFVQVPKIHKIYEICSPQERRPTLQYNYVTYCPSHKHEWIDTQNDYVRSHTNR